MFFLYAYHKYSGWYISYRGYLSEIIGHQRFISECALINNFTISRDFIDIENRDKYI